MKRSTVVTDRVGTAVAGLGVLALGTSAAAWQLDRLPVPRDSTLQIRGLSGIVGAWWWPYALAVVALILIAAGVRWLYAHRPGQSVGATTLPNSSPAGELTLDLNTAASAAAAVLLENPCVASASGTSRIDRGERIIQVDVTLASDPGALVVVTNAVREVSGDLARALAGVPFTSRVLLRTSRTAGGTPRVA